MPERSANRLPREELMAYVGTGTRVADIAEQCGVRSATVYGWIERDHVPWIKANWKLVRYGGKWMPLERASKMSGISYATLWLRYQRGERGDNLFRPVTHHHSRQPKPIYEVGLSHEEWRGVLAVYDHLIGVYGSRSVAKRRTANRCGVPAGAIGCAERGEWHRLG